MGWFPPRFSEHSAGVPHQPTMKAAHRALIPGGGVLAGDRGSALRRPADIAKSGLERPEMTGMRRCLPCRVCGHQLPDQSHPHGHKGGVCTATVSGARLGKSDVTTRADPSRQSGIGPKPAWAETRCDNSGVGKAGVVEEHDENVRCAGRSFRRGRPVRCRVCDCAADTALEGAAHVDRSVRSSGG